jgi:hypothetical protein
MHCHMIGDAERKVWRDEKRPIPDDVLFPWPLPEVVGLELDPQKKASVHAVAEGSPAARAGFRTGDEITALAGQPVLSIADVQWALHRSGPKALLAAEIRRGGEARRLTLALDEGWRRRGDISWRTTSWDLRRMATGGLLLEELGEEERRARSIGCDRLALLVEHAGEYGEHRTALDAGFRKGDVIVEWDGRSERLRETDLLAHGVQVRKPGERVKAAVLRGGKRLELELPLR